MRVRPFVVVSLLCLALASTVPVQAADTVSIEAPSAAPDGESVRIEATGSSDAQVEPGMELKVFRMDTKEELCSDTADTPGAVSCTAVITMPADDVELRAVLAFETGAGLAEDRTTITATAPQPADDAADNSETDSDPAPDDTESSPDTNTDTGDTAENPTPDAPTQPPQDEDNGGLIDAVIDGITDAGKQALGGALETTFGSILTAFFVKPVADFFRLLVNMLAAVLTTVPQIHPNPAVEAVHQDTLFMAFLLSVLGAMLAGLLYMTGPFLGMSSQQIQPILPRLILALVFSAVSLPFLQLTVEIANAMTTAFAPQTQSLGEAISQGLGTGAVISIAVYIQTAVLLPVILVYILQDIYILFVASIAPLVAVAWAVPFTRRYATAFIGGYWTCLAMGPLAMLVVRFSFALMAGTGSSLGQVVMNWVYGAAALMLLLVIPFQFYGASQTLLGTSSLLTGNAMHTTQKRMRRAEQQHIRRRRAQFRHTYDEDWYARYAQWEDRYQSQPRLQRVKHALYPQPGFHKAPPGDPAHGEPPFGKENR